MKVHRGHNPATDCYLYAANANVAAPSKGTIRTVPAYCDYGPFGEVVRATGFMARQNHFRIGTGT